LRGRHGASLLHQFRTSGMPCRRRTNRCSRSPAATPIWMFRHDMTRAIRRRSSARWPWGTAAPVQPGHHGSLSEGIERGQCRDLRLQPRLQEDLRFADGVPKRRQSLVAGRRIFLRNLHDPHPPEGVSDYLGVKLFWRTGATLCSHVPEAYPTRIRPCATESESREDCPWRPARRARNAL
jgi:hypothetical protein